MSSQNFILVEGASNKVSEFLVQEVSGFSNSDEYLRLDDEDRKSPGIVCGAFANYISRIYGERGNAGLVLDNAFNAIESLSSVQDSDVENLVVTEILENIHFDEYPELIQKLGSKSKALHERWIT
ncbi:hypothetical protein [Halochromatium glycolicum]|uniref:hypothetical protein n=1 Tax=Halochromatium glycolicum TaxID=85075 RepID=UPI00190E514A|nr:hypothetical protein [Halochromatium glycolicum]